MPIIIENLNYTYDPKAPFEKTALKNISMRIEDGDFFGIIGATGSGKSTLIAHLNGLKKVMSGSIFVDDIDLSKKYDYKKLRSLVGMVFQYPEYQLFDETVAKDIGFGPRNLRLKPEEVDERVRSAIKMVGLDYDQIAARSPFELSGGQMRRVAIAGVLSMRPKILVLDEPTAGLDPKGKKHILQLINSIREFCPTIIMISHNMDEIFSNCNKIAILSQGELKGVFSPEQLYENCQLIEQCGLSMPSTFKIANELNKNGFSIGSAANSRQLAEEIFAQCKGDKPNA